MHWKHCGNVDPQKILPVELLGPVMADSPAPGDPRESQEQMAPTASLSAGFCFVAVSPVFSALNSTPVLARSEPCRPGRGPAGDPVVPLAAMLCCSRSLVGRVEIGTANTNPILKVRFPYVPC